MSKTVSLFNIFNIRGIKPKKNNSFMNSQLKLESHNLLNMNDYTKLADQNSIEEIYKMLEEQYYFNLNSTFSLKENFNILDQEYMNKVLKAFGNKSYGRTYYSLLDDYFLIPRDLFNFKVLTKGFSENIDFNQLPLGLVGYISLEQLEIMYKEELPINTKIELKKIWLNYLKEKELLVDSYHIDLFWDKQIHVFYANLFKTMGSDILSLLYATQIDMINILTTLRLKLASKEEKDLHNALIPNGNIKKITLIALFYGEIDNIIEILNYPTYEKEIKVGLEAFKETQSFATLEKYLNEYMLNIYRRFLSLCSNEDLVIIYHWLKKTEVANICVIVSGKENSMPIPWIISKLKGTI